MESELDIIKKQVVVLKKIIQEDANEKGELSYALHENIAQILAAVRLHIGLAKMGLNEPNLAFLNEAEQLLQEAISTIKTLASSISPIVLETFGFTNHINDLFSLLKEHIEVDSIVDINETTIFKTPVHFQNIAYQVVQMHVINILKRATVKTLTINIKDNNSKMHIFIIEDGINDVIGNGDFEKGFTSLIEKVQAFDGFVKFYFNETKDKFTLEMLL
jgi:signal transduction histidine kinase